MTLEAGTGQRAAHLNLEAGMAATLRGRLPMVAERTVSAITAEVPDYSGALTGAMRAKIENAVRIALGTFLQLIEGTQAFDPSTPLAPALEAAYALGSGEAEAVEIQSREVYDRYMKYLTGCADLFRDGYTDICQFTLQK